MTSRKRFQESDANLLPAELEELGRLVKGQALESRRDLDIAFERVAESVQRRRRILNLVQEALAQLRLDVKYLIFDLDVTRRERDDLKAQIEEEDLDL